MKIVSEKDFMKIHEDLIWIYSNVKAVITKLELDIKYQVKDEQLKRNLESQIKFLKNSSGGLDDIDKLKNEIFERGILNKGLRY